MSASVSRLLTAAASLALAVSGALASVPADAAGTPACTNGDLTSSYHRGDGAAGTVYGWIVLRNTSGHACRTGGYGGISYVGTPVRCVRSCSSRGSDCAARSPRPRR